MTHDDPPSDNLLLGEIEIDTAALESDLNAQGWSVVPDLLTGTQCDDIANRYDQQSRCHGAVRLRSRRVPVLFVSAAAASANAGHHLP